MSRINSPALGRIEQRRATDEVYDSLRRAILDRSFKPGTRLNVEDLASQLGVSLTPIRSAIQLLAAEGLIDVHSRSGTFVATLTRRDLEEIFDIRCALETLAAESAARNLTDEQIHRAQVLLKTLGKPISNDATRAAHERANSELHNTIVDASGNQRLRDIYSSLQAHIAMQRVHHRDSTWQARLPQEQQEHERIVIALAARDSEALSQALREHILRAKEALAQTMGEVK